MLISRDLDCTNTMYVQFSLRFIAKGKYEFIIFLQENSPLYNSFSTKNHRFKAHKFCYMEELTYIGTHKCLQVFFFKFILI